MTEENPSTLSTTIYNELKILLHTLEIRDYSIHLTKGSVKGDNYLGVITKAKVNGKNKKGETTSLCLILKCAPESEKFRNYVKIEPLYAREVFMYQKVFPELLKLQEELGLRNPFYPLAKHYKSSLQLPVEYLILEDMNTQGYIMKDRKSITDLDHCLLVMKAYGKFHALALALKDQKFSIYQSLLESTRDTYFPNLDLDSLSKTLETCSKNVIKNLHEADDDEEELIKKLQDFVKFPKTRLTEVRSAEAAGDHVVFCHGDCWSNNILYKYEDENNPSKPTDLCIVDWQLSCCGSPAIDLGYFISTCTEKTLRDSHFDELLQTYHSTFCCFLEELGSDPNIFSYEMLLEHMRKFTKYGLMMALMVAHLVAADNDEIPDWTSDMSKSERDELFTKEAKNENIVTKKLVDLVKDFHRLGYLD